MTARHLSGCHPERGALINALATAGSRRVHAEEAFAKCDKRPEKITARVILGLRVSRLQDEEREARAALERWEASA